jgi:hypothetical protein
VTNEDILATEDIFGPNVGSLKGKTARRTPKHVRSNRADIPTQILSRYREVTLACDVMYVNGIPFLVSISRHIKFRTAAQLLASIKLVTQTYATRGFLVTRMMVDGQFEPLCGELAGLGIAVNCVSRDEHVPEIERHIRTLKERTRCIHNQLPFEKMPARITIEMVYSSNFWLNMFPPADGVSKTMSPRAIIAGGELDYLKHCRLEFGTYCQVHEEHDNSMTTQTTGAIALRPTGNIQGGYYVFSLTTGHRLNRNRWTELPMPANVIERVHTLSRRGLAVDGLSFADCNGNDPSDEDLNDDDADDDDDDDTWNPGPDDDDVDDADDDTNDGNDDDAATIGDTIAGVDDGDNIAVPKVRENNFPENYSHDTKNDTENDFHDTKNLAPSDAPETDERINDRLEPIPEHPETEHHAKTDEPTNDALEPTPEYAKPQQRPHPLWLEVPLKLAADRICRP